MAKGLPLTGEFNNFQNILHNLWWKIDRALDKEMIEASAQMAAIESIRNGVTYIFDHHSSQSEIEGSLNMIRNVLENFELRGVLCFESTDRNGSEKAMEGLEENQKFYDYHFSDDFKAMLGLHASFTLSDDTLNEAQQMMENDWGIHIHVAEDQSDIKLSVEYADSTPISRLDEYELMNEKSILVHGVHLKKEDYLKIIEAGSALAFCPDSNLNNSVGLPQFAKIPKGIPILVGTDGMHANVARSLKQIFLLCRNQGMSFDDSTTFLKKIFFDQIAFVKKYFPDYPNLLEHDRADFIIWDYIPPTPLIKDNFWGHFIYGMSESNIYSVIQNGELLMSDFKIKNTDEEKIRNQVFIQGERLYKSSYDKKE
ncbi:MAG: amidohydrolase family protein [bacterium]